MGDTTTIAVGTGATLMMWTDRHAYTVIAVSKSGKRITLRRDRARLLNGVNSGEADSLEFSPGGFVGHTSGVQRYAYEQDSDGAVITATLRTLPSGETIWKQAGVPTKQRGGRVLIGERDEHYDFNF